jgi:hypothetical protein
VVDRVGVGCLAETSEVLLGVEGAGKADGSSERSKASLLGRLLTDGELRAGKTLLEGVCARFIILICRERALLTFAASEVVYEVPFRR